MINCDKFSRKMFFIISRCIKKHELSDMRLLLLSFSFIFNFSIAVAAVTSSN